MGADLRGVKGRSVCVGGVSEYMSFQAALENFLFHLCGQNPTGVIEYNFINFAH